MRRTRQIIRRHLNYRASRRPKFIADRRLPSVIPASPLFSPAMTAPVSAVTTPASTEEKV